MKAIIFFITACALYPLSVFILPIEGRAKAEAFTTIASQAFIKSQRFSVPERERIKAYIAESGVQIRSRQAGVLVRSVFGIDNLVAVDIRSYKAGERPFEKKPTCQVSAEIAIRIIDAATGRTICQSSKRVDRTLDGECPVLRPEDPLFLREAAGAVLVECMDDAVAAVIESLHFPPIEGRIIKIDKGKAYCSVGERHRVSLGQRFDIVTIHTETPFETPDGQTNVKQILVTNLTLGEAASIPTGKGRIIEVNRDFSIMELISFPSVIPALASLRIIEESSSIQ